MASRKNLQWQGLYRGRSLTGSMGEGIAIGFNASIHAVIMGTRMAGLLK